MYSTKEDKVSFILPSLFAFGRINSEKYPIELNSIGEYLASCRKYERIEIQPLIIQTEETEESLERGWIFSPRIGYSLVASYQGLYEIRLRDPDFDASNLTDALHGMMAVLGGPPSEELFVIPVAENSIPPSRIISLDEAVKFYRDMLPHASAARDDNDSIFRGRWGRTPDFDAALWQLVANVIGDEELVYASLFLRVAVEKYSFSGDEVEDVILRHEEVPSRILKAIDVENGIHNAYKIVEAIYGGTLPSDWRKVARCLAEQGIDTAELAGYTMHGIFRREPILEKIKRLKHARDDRAAHGRIHENRRNTYYELMDYQELVRNLLIKRIQTKYPGTLNLSE
ncbi:hypothetical protein [Nitrosovibrio tenuis]|uniref:Apea-like HEPN domain-containing protein n=1 Tax=Nitrosovibrio tenuis TaxID=1233 RepID=A0A1H7NWN5_9PROT|nr:hypothetical protein [Nitrosovibrio tenuis]SEL27297.1 hypothetical protein SAMN05216387_107146 [Nitrosovibrio tenuis]